MRNAGTTRVQVAEGKVIYNPDLDKLALDAGATLLIEPDGVTLGRMTPGDIGGWRTGTLVYEGAQLATVPDELARSLGRPNEVAPAIARSEARSAGQEWCCNVHTRRSQEH